MAVPLLDLPAQYVELQSELDDAWYKTMETAGFVGGKAIEELETAIAKYVGTDYAVSCGNGTDALFLTLAALGIGPGDEVITTPFTFWATVEAIVHVGATPVFVDIEPGTYNMDVKQVEWQITKNTKAIMPVHIFGQCVRMDGLYDIVDGTDIAIVEDACQAIGADWGGMKAGSLGIAGCFSFFPSKNLGCAGDGGMVTTDSKKIADKVRKLANHGTTQKYFHDEFGTNSRLDALQARILLAKLPHLDGWNQERREAAQYYNAEFQKENVSDIELPVYQNYGNPVVHLYILKAESTLLAEEIMSKLKANEIDTALYYPQALHEQEAFTSQPGYEKPDLPVAESCDGRTFAIPCFPGITREQQDQVIWAVTEAL